MHTDVQLLGRTESITKPRSKAIRTTDPKSNTQTTERGKIVSLLSHISVFTIQVKTEIYLSFLVIMHKLNFSIMTTNDRLIYATIISLQCVYKSGELDIHEINQHFLSFL